RAPAGAEPPAPGGRDPAPAEERGLWDVYWDRFRRQEVDDPVEDRREGMWDRFKRQQVDDPVDRRRS
ncbi:MAG: hypothetical protein JOZ95_05330, partial [Solirubrobacterales bacterium]|nr:hypothetical protein [Solirubrobacterales bacterium]